MFDIAAAGTNACAVELKVCGGKKWKSWGDARLYGSSGGRRQDAFAAKFSGRRGDAE